MSATATSPNNAKPGRLDVNSVRDDLARHYNSTGAFELMLTMQMARTWVRLQEAYDADQRYRAGRDVLELMTVKLAEFKAVQSYVRDCERAWNHAKEDLEKEQRKRQREAKKPEPRSTLEHSKHTTTAPPPHAMTAPAASAAAPRRE